MKDGAAPATARVRRRPDRLWVAYGAGHFGKSLMWHSSELLFAFYLTQVCGMAPRVMAPVLAVALFASGLFDVAVGQALRRRVRTVRAAAAVQALGACGAGVAFFLFLAIAFLPGPERVAMGVALGLAFRCAYAFYDVPQNAVLGLARGDQLRAGLSALRFACSGLASLAIAAAAALLLTRQPQTHWFAALGASVGVAAIATALLFLWTARTAAAAAPAPVQAQAGAALSAWPALVRLLCLGFAITASSVVFMKLEPYFAAAMATTVARAALMGAVACGGIACQGLTLWGSVRWQPAATVKLCALAALAGGAGFAALAPQHAAWACACGFLVGFGLNGLGMLLWTAVGNLTAASALLSPALAFGLLTCSQKTASALGILVIGAMLDWRAGSGPAAFAMAPIVLAMGCAPVAGALVFLLAAARRGGGWN